MRTEIAYTAGVVEKSTTLVFGSVENERAGKVKGWFQGEIYPGELFCLRVYHQKLFGSTRWALYVAEAVSEPGEAQFIPYVFPGARVLLHVLGAKKVSNVIKWLEEEKKSKELTAIPKSAYMKQHGVFQTDFSPHLPKKPLF